MTINGQKRILIAPLDWGLGHTSRCVPLIGHLLEKGHHPLFAGNAWQRSFIANTFPSIDTIHKEGYNVTYARSAAGFAWSLALQLPQLLRAIREENEWLRHTASTQGVQGIISDNRYGMYHPAIPSVILTHQLRIRTGFGTLPDSVLQRIHYKYLRRFSACWVPDLAGADNLSGSLGHPGIKPPALQYLGLLSQMAPAAASAGRHLLIVLSGPEPQRTILSGILWHQVQDHQGEVVFVEGSNEATAPAHIPGHIRYHKQLQRAQLQPLFSQASYIVCRSGYSTIMDLVALGKKALLVPTPGQTEQEYLARRLHRQGAFFRLPQRRLILGKALEQAKDFPFTRPYPTNAFSQFRPVLDDWLLSL